MKFALHHVLAALALAFVSHLVFVNAVPRVLMGVAIERLSQGGANQWRVSERITPLSRQVVRPSPDFAYSACVFDLSDGPVRIAVVAWPDYWSLSLYADNSDNFFVLDDRETRAGASLVLGRRATREVKRAGETFVKSPSKRGIALIRRLAPSVDAYNQAARIAIGDVCAPFSS